MTGSTDTTRPQDFAIHVAENEGMPTRSRLRDATIMPAHPRRLVGTLTLGLSQSLLGTRGIWSAKERAEMRHSLAMPITRTAVIGSKIAPFAVPVFSQDGTGPTHRRFIVAR